MLYETGQLVQWKKWIGKIRFCYPGNKSYMVTLYGYRNTEAVDKQIDQMELCEI